MARKERTSKGRTMRPNYFVFCEGESEVAYTEMLRGWYRLPIHIIAKKTSLNVTPALVERCKALYVQTKADKTYLMYDLDVEGVLERLQKVSDATLLCSNPCFELWLLLHYVGQRGALASDACVARLKKHVPQYRKGVLGAEMQLWLMKHVGEASERARQLEAYGNPSATVYRLTDELERMKLKQLVLEFVRNVGDKGASIEDIYAYLKDAMPGNKTKEQHLRLLGNLLKEMKDEKTVYSIGLSWYDSSLNPTRTD